MDADESASGDWTINAVVYASGTSPASVPAYGNLLMQSIAQTVTNDPTLKLSFNYRAYDLTTSAWLGSNSLIGSATVQMGNMSLYIIEMATIMATITHIFSDYHGMIMVRGATNCAYVVSRMMIDFLSYFVFLQIFFVMNTLFQVDTSGWQSLGILFCVAACFQQAAFNALSMGQMKCATCLRVALFAVAFLLLSFVGAFIASYLSSASGYETL